jgi:phosphoribosyl-AMP cyclohydrolase
MSVAPVRFQARKTIEQVEEGNDLAPRFDERGLITVVTTDAASGELLMQGYMNAEALQLTISTGEAHYYSRSRQVLWHKGATSGLVQTVRELLVDDDQDCIWLRVDVAGGASCHVGYRSCFYRKVPVGNDFSAKQVEGHVDLEWTDTEKVFDPEDVYGDRPPFGDNACFVGGLSRSRQAGPRYARLMSRQQTSRPLAWSSTIVQRRCHKL